MPSLYLNRLPPNPAWLSPALSVRKSAGLDPDAGTPILDVDPDPPSTEFQFLSAIAGNDTTATTFVDVKVQLWALAFATATSSNLYLTSMGSTAGAQVPAGGAMPITIGPTQEQPFERAWNRLHGLTSTEPEITGHFSADEVHCCIYANVHHPGDATSAPIPNVASGPGPLLDVAGNRHHAQRNMTIKKKVPRASLAFQMYAANPDFERDQNVLLQITERTPRKLREWELDELAALGPWIRRRTREPFKARGAIQGLEIVLGRKRLPLRIATKPLPDLEMDVHEAGADRELKFPMGADEARRMQLNATLPDEEFVLRILDVAQTQGRKTVGGARVMLLTVPEELHKPRRELG